MTVKPEPKPIDSFADLRHPDRLLSEQEAAMWLLSAAERRKGVRLKFNEQTELWERE